MYVHDEHESVVINQFYFYGKNKKYFVFSSQIFCFPYQTSSDFRALCYSIVTSTILESERKMFRLTIMDFFFFSL